MTERLPFHFSLSCIGEGNGNPLQCSCLENPRDGRAWWAAVYGVAQSQTRLKRLSSSSSSSVGNLCDSLNVFTASSAIPSFIPYIGNFFFPDQSTERSINYIDPVKRQLQSSLIFYILIILLISVLYSFLLPTLVLIMFISNSVLTWILNVLVLPLLSKYLHLYFFF